MGLEHKKRYINQKNTPKKKTQPPTSTNSLLPQSLPPYLPTSPLSLCALGSLQHLSSSHGSPSHFFFTASIQTGTSPPPFSHPSTPNVTSQTTSPTWRERAVKSQDRSSSLRAWVSEEGEGEEEEEEERIDVMNLRREAWRGGVMGSRRD